MRFILPLLLVIFQCAFAGVYGIKILNDNQPDYHDGPSFVRSVSYGWTTNQQKAINLWKWVSVTRVQQDLSAGEHGDGEWDLITYMNSCGAQFCGMINSAIGAAWEYTGNYYHTNSLNAHNTVDIWYDNAFHMFDASIYNYVLMDNGTVAGSADLNTTRRLCYHNSPQLACDSGSLYTYNHDVNWLAGCYGMESKLKQGYCSAMNQVWLGMRPYESYKRYKDPVAPADTNYFIPCYYDRTGTSGGGLIPNQGWGNNTVATSGEWVLDPDFSKSDWIEAVFDTVNMASQAATPYVYPKTAGTDGCIIFSINAFNAIASAQIDANVVKGAGDEAEVYISDNAGKTWTSLGAMPNGAFTKKLRNEVLAERGYMIKVRLKAASTPTSVGLTSFRIKTITQLSRRAFFFLERGNNKMFVNLDNNQLERIELRPNLGAAAYANHVFAQTNMTGVTGNEQIKVMPAGAGAASLVYKIDAPGDVKKITMAGRFWRRNNEPIRFYYSTDAGVTWVKLGADAHYNCIYGGAWDGKWEYNGDNFQSITLTAAGIRSVLFKCEITATGTEHNGIHSLWMAADYVAPHSPFKPLEITLCWEESHAAGPAVRRHVKVINTYAPWTSYDVNVGGLGRPVMMFYTVNLSGHNPDGALAEGYSDGTDVGAGIRQERVYYDKKNLLSRNKTAACPVAPASGALSMLTDEVVPYGENTSGSGCRWAKAANPVITLDLGSSVPVQGVTVFLGAPANSYEYPDSVQVYSGDSLSGLGYCGTIYKADLWCWPVDFCPPESWDRIDRQDAYQRNLASYDFPLSFGAAKNARYLQFTVFNSVNPFILWEVRAWGTLAKKTWRADGFNHPVIDSIKTAVLPVWEDLRQGKGALELFPVVSGNNVLFRVTGENRIRGLSIYDTQGRLVYSNRSSAANGQWSEKITWNGEDNLGRKVANGNYFIRVNTLKGEATPKVNLVR